MAELSIETNIDGLKDCLYLFTVLVNKYGDNGVLQLEDTDVECLEGDNRLIVSVDPFNNKITLTHTKVEGTMR